MTKIFKVALVSILIVGLTCGYKWWAVGSILAESFRQNRVLSKFDVESYVFWRGEKAFRDFVVEKASASELMFFDGDDRWAYVLKSRHEYHQDDSDLCQFGVIEGSQIGMIWRGPGAASITDVEFHDDDVKVSIALRAQGGSLLMSKIGWELIESKSGSGHLRDYLVTVSRKHSN